MKKDLLVIHIGYPKTATTFLQNKIFTPLFNRGDIYYLGKFEEKSLKIHHPDFVKEMVYTGDLDRFKSEFNWIKNTKHQTYLLSFEEFSISYEDEVSKKMNKVSNAFLTATHLKKSLVDFFSEIKIIITIRNQQSLIYSFYAEVYRRRFKQNSQLDNFSKFLKYHFNSKTFGEQDMFNFNDLIALYCQLFGFENVNIFLYEDFCNYPTQFLKKIYSLLQVNTPLNDNLILSMDVNSKKKINNNYVAAEFTFSNLIEKYVGKLMKQRLFKGSLRNKIGFLRKPYKMVSLHLFKKLRISKGEPIKAPSDEELILISEFYRESNKALISRYKFDKNRMQEYGYL